MDGYQFTASIIQSIVSLAWPAALVISVYLFREKLIQLLPLLRVKHKDWEASFRLDKAEEEALTLPAGVEPTVEQQPTPEEKSRFEQLAELSPRAAILEVRTELSQSVETMATQFGKSTVRPLTLLSATRALRNGKIIDASTSAILDDLRVIGNDAAHDADANFTKDDAIRFRALADTVLSQLTRVALGLPLGP